MCPVREPEVPNVTAAVETDVTPTVIEVELVLATQIGTLERVVEKFTVAAVIALVVISKNLSLPATETQPVPHVGAPGVAVS